MAQFDVYRLDGDSYVVDCQSDTLSYLTTRVVAPLMRCEDVPSPSEHLHPVFRLNGESFLLATHLLTAIPLRALNRPIASLDNQGYEIIAALDLLLTGV